MLLLKRVSHYVRKRSSFLTIEIFQVYQSINHCQRFIYGNLLFNVTIFIISVTVIRRNFSYSFSTPYSLRRYSPTHFSTELTIHSTSSGLISETEGQVAISKSIYSSTVISASLNSLKSSLNSSSTTSSSTHMTSY